MTPTETTTTQPNWRTMMEATLYQNLKASPKWDIEHKELTLTVTMKRPNYLIPPISWIVRPPKTRQIQLDPIGGQLWEWCDGQRTVEDVIELFAQKYNLTFHEGRVSVTSYLKELLKRGALAVAL